MKPLHNHITFVGTTMNNYKMIDIIKYVAAIMVIVIHCNQIVPQEYLNFFIKNIVCRIAVPFFFISNAYFVRRGERNHEQYVRGYLRSLMKSYALWSLLFVPIGLDWIHQNLSLSQNLLPLALLYGLFHIGTYYHLWYIPAMIFSIFLLHHLVKHVSYKTLFIVSFAMFLFGSLESYYGLLQNGWFKDSFDVLMRVISTTRSGLLYGMIFTLLGFYIYDRKDTIQALLKYVPILSIASFVFLIIEGNFLYQIQRLDMNFLIMLVPFSFFFFVWILACPCIPKFKTEKIRTLSKYYYFIHPISIVIVEQVALGFHMDLLSSGILSLLLILLLTHVLSNAIISTKAVLHKRSMLVASIGGLLITFVLASLFFLLKSSDAQIKFELVPCLWICFSFIIYRALLTTKVKNPYFNEP